MMKRRRTPWIGPLFTWELIRLARRGQDFRLRVLIAFAMLFTLIVFTAVWFGGGSINLVFGSQEVLNTGELARFADQFSLALLICQLAFLGLITPAYAAGSIAEEKEQRTWEYLLSSELSRREIILGKYCGRVVFLLGVLFAGLPVLAITGLVGGIDPLYLAFAYVLTAGTVAMLAALSFAVAVSAQSFRGAVVMSYALCWCFLLLGSLFSPFFILIAQREARVDTERFLLIAGLYFAFQLLVTVSGLWLAVRRLRRSEHRQPLTENAVGARPMALPAGAAKSRRWGETESERRRTHAAKRRKWRPPVGEHDPFEWKEMYFSALRSEDEEEQYRGLFNATVIFCVILLMIGFLISTLGRNTDRYASNLFVLSGLTAVFVQLLTISTAGCATVKRERTRGTLESLLATPEDRKVILAAKWKASAMRGWTWGGTGLFLAAFGLLFSPVPSLAFPVAVYLAVAVYFTAAFSIWLSVTCSSIVRATMIAMSVAGLLIFVPLAVWYMTDRRDGMNATLLMTLCVAILAAAGWLFKLRAEQRFGRLEL